MSGQRGISTVASLVAGIATLAVLALLWLAMNYSDKRIWLGLGLLMALSPLAMVWRLLRNEQKASEQKED